MASPVAQVRLDSLGTHWSREALTVVGAGLVTTVEAIVTVKPSLLAGAAKAELNTATTVVAIVATLAAASIVGYTCRSLVFLLATLLRSLGKVGGWLLERPTKEEQLARYLSDRFGDDDLRCALEGSPALEATNPLRLRRAHWPYCKFWLRVHRPELAVDNLETDINISYALVVPALLGGPSAVSALAHVGVIKPDGVPYGWSLVVGSVLAFMLFRRGLWRQRREAYEALENYVVARLLGPPPEGQTRQGESRTNDEGPPP